MTFQSNTLNLQLCNICCITVVVFKLTKIVIMPPKFKVSKEEIISAALFITRRAGIGCVTAREIGAELGLSSRPIFSWFESMQQVRDAVYDAAKQIYTEYLQRGLSQPIPFLGLGQQFIRFAQKEGELYRLLFLTKPKDSHGGAIAAMKYTQELARPSLMLIYKIDAHTADCYFRDLWLVAFSFGTLIVTNGCFYTNKEISAIMTEFSLSICKAYKEIPGLPDGKIDIDAQFKAIIGR